MHTSPAAALRSPRAPRRFLCTPALLQLSDLLVATKEILVVTKSDPGQAVPPAQARNTRNKCWIYSFYSLCLLYLQAWGPHFLSSVRGMCGPHFLLGCTSHLSCNAQSI